jgi:hypothetical protein
MTFTTDPSTGVQRPSAVNPEPPTVLFGLNLQVLARSHGWAIDPHGNLFALTRDDGEYVFTGIRFDEEALAQWKHDYRPQPEAAGGRKTVATEGEALAIARANEQRLRYELNLFQHAFAKAGVRNLADETLELLHSTPLIPTVAPITPEPHESGPWSYGRDVGDSRHFLQSDDFTHDVRLYINGDFANAEQCEHYGRALADRMNQTLGCAPRRKYPPIPLDTTSQKDAVPTAPLAELVDFLRAQLNPGPGVQNESDKVAAIGFAHDFLASLIGLKAPPRARSLKSISRKEQA